MKLENVKNKIDYYFVNIDGDSLLDISKKYGIFEINNKEHIKKPKKQ